MRIEELILEGFKSYPVRTTITGWDPSFNAITGLNGSGKSNILDAICFVLGITNMTQVRANNLMDLIYKRGQAGVTKASVTIVFNNQDRATSPVGFENTAQITVTRQIAVGNTSKYLLNGHKSTLQALQNLFQSVQLNINNPNFLIMQGKITKVLNMKPQEILGMVEEASGTRMFEDRKEKAWKTMARKEKKVEELASLLREEIEPKLEKLREEKRSYLAYQKATSELERLTRLVKAYEWTLAVQRAAAAASEIEQRRSQIKAAQKDAAAYADEQGRMEKEILEIQKRRDKELSKGGKFQALADTVAALERELVKVQTQLEIKAGTVADEAKRLQNAKKGVEDLKASTEAKREQTSTDTAAFAKFKASYDASAAEVAKTEELLQTLLTGLSTSGNSDDDGAGGYMGQLADSKAAAAAAGTEAEQAKIKMGLVEREIKDKEPRARKAAKEGEGLTSELENKKKELEKLKGSLGAADWKEGREAELLQGKAEHSSKIAELLESRDSLKSKLAAIDFTYSDPYPNFDRSKVKGLVASLVDLDEANYKSSTALEICAGGKLYNVVVEDEKVGSALLDKGRLRKRVTIIPLNKINAFRMSVEKLAAAKKLAPGKVNLALDLVGYEEDVSAAMAYVFGDMLICNDKESAQQVTFNKAIGVKSVTLDGDVYDPSGTLSGGAAPSGSGVIVKVQELKVIEKQINEHKHALATIEAELKKAKSAIDAFKKNKRELDLKLHEVSLLEEQVQGSNAAKIIAEVDLAKKTLVELKETMASAKEKQKAAAAECKRLEKEMADFKNNKDSKLTELRATIATKKKELQKRTTELKTRQKEAQTAELELEQMETDCKAAAEEIEEIEAAVAKGQKEHGVLEKSLATQKKDHAAAEAKLKTERAVLSAFDEELDDLDRDLKTKKQEIVDAELTLKKLEHDVGSTVKEKASAEGVKQSLEQQFSWIADESKFFGKANTQYDFDGVNLSQVREKTRELEAQQKGMGRKINTKVMNMIDSVEKKEQSLTKMMSTVMGDKGKIEQTIAELDRYKRDALMKTWEKVNGDFGNIFAELLPGNFAKLQPPEGLDLTEGLEVKVRLGSVWKASLTELSGGQRSLIALSLIMSLLQFKPAPMYILDEIDAALDLQHTQHIGQLFRNRFKGSQFIVVSLKEGLFTNANVLFRARFRDGTSVVERTAHRSIQSEDKENEAPAVARGKGAPARARGAVAARA